MTFSGTQINSSHFYLSMICDCYKTGKQKVVQNDNNQKECLTSGKNKASLCPLKQFNKTYNKADHIKTCLLACVDSHCESKFV